MKRPVELAFQLGLATAVLTVAALHAQLLAQDRYALPCGVVGSPRQ